MKCLIALAFVLGSHAIQLQEQTTPMARVASLLMHMKARIDADGKTEQMSYDKYACWCENTMERKANDISEAKKLSKELQAKIIKLEGELGAHGAEIKQLEADIAANFESQRDAKAVRAKEKGQYGGEKTESEQCMGALEAAIKVLTSGTSGGFLETMKQVQLLSVASGVRGAMSKSKSMSAQDLLLINNFIDNPSDFVGKRSGSLSAAQVGNNPFGDYAPQSTQIQGILRGMYEGFANELERDNAEEAQSQKAFLQFMATKQQELASLQQSLQTEEGAHAKKSLEKDEANEQLDDTQAQLKADEKFFEATKAGCKEKAQQWSVRSGLRAQELTGVGMAINILTSPDARTVFQNSTTTFFQVSAVSRNGENSRVQAQAQASAQLTRLAQKYGSLELATVAVELKSSGHFDKVIVSIDEMIAALRQEEQEDIDHRDRCERAQFKNTNEKSDISGDITKAGTSIGLLEADAVKIKQKISTLEGQITATEGDLATALSLRNEDVAEFRQALKDDFDAVGLLDRTITALSGFYKRNRIPMSLAQTVDPVYNYTIDEDKAPETSWEGDKYGGRNEETHGIVEIIRMLKEDIEKEIDTSRQDNADAQTQYEQERGDLEDTLNAQLALKDSTERQLAGNEADTHDKQKFKSALGDDLTEQDTLSGAITNDCAWVATNFASRREKRKNEIEGLIDAKGYLAGAEDGSLI